MPKFLETKLKREYGEKSAIPYKVMNAQGLMHGNKETAKGAAMEKKHESHMRELRVEIHRGPKNEVTGYTVHKHMVPKKKSAAFMESETHQHPFSAAEHGKMMAHVEDHLDSVQE